MQTLESMSSDLVLAVHIAKDGIARLVGPLLIDHNVLVRAGSASALRYIADNGKTEAYENLIKDDIMTLLCASLKQVSVRNTRFFHYCSNLFIVYSVIPTGNQNLFRMRKIRRTMRKKHSFRQ